MKKMIVLLLLILICNATYAQSKLMKDVMIASDGMAACIKGDSLHELDANFYDYIYGLAFKEEDGVLKIKDRMEANACYIPVWSLYIKQQDSVFELSKVVCRNDSAFLISMDDAYASSPNFITSEGCKSPYKITSSCKIKDFIRNYKLSVYPNEATSELVMRIDTIGYHRAVPVLYFDTIQEPIGPHFYDNLRMIHTYKVSYFYGGQPLYSHNIEANDSIKILRDEDKSDFYIVTKLYVDSISKWYFLCSSVYLNITEYIISHEIDTEVGELMTKVITKEGVMPTYTINLLK